MKGTPESIGSSFELNYESMLAFCLSGGLLRPRRCRPCDDPRLGDVHQRDTGPNPRCRLGSVTDGGSGALRTATFANTGYTLGRVYFSGSLQEINGTIVDFASDNRMRVTLPGGQFTDVALSTTNGYSGTIPFSGSFFVAPGLVPPYGARARPALWRSLAVPVREYRRRQSVRPDRREYRLDHDSTQRRGSDRDATDE